MGELKCSSKLNTSQRNGNLKEMFLHPVELVVCPDIVILSKFIIQVKLCTVKA
jgi:hypothetical protein